MSDPYQGTVNCYWCKLEDEIDIPAFGKSKYGQYACKEHCNLLLIAGWYGGPLPEMDEAIKIMQEMLES